MGVYKLSNRIAAVENLREKSESMSLIAAAAYPESKRKKHNPRLLFETFEKCSILFKFKEDENFKCRNTLSIFRIKI